MPNISVVIPVYNNNEFQIKRAVQSVLNQTYSNFEIIIINDGSENQYDSIYRDLESLDTRITYYKKKNGGASSARNYGVLHARGNYISFLDADDALLPNFLEEALSILIEEGADFVIGGVSISDSFDIKKSKNTNIQTYTKERIPSMIKHFLGDILYFEDGYINRGPVSRLLKIEYAKKVMFDEKLVLGEDVVWNLDLLSLVNKVCIVKKVWYIYYENPISALHRYSELVIKQLADKLIEIKKRININEDNLKFSYCNQILHDLKRVNDQFYNHEDCSLSIYEKNQIIKNNIYNKYPWNEILDFNFFMNSSIKDKIVIIFYKLRILYYYWTLKKSIGGVFNG